MIDFTGVKAVTIPQGSVTKITRGSTVLWEKPSEQNYIVVFPETTLEGRCYEDLGFTNFAPIFFNDEIRAGVHYIIVLNGQELNRVSTDDGGYITLYPGEPYIGTYALNTNECYMSLNGNIPTVTLEVRYIPE